VSCRRALEGGSADKVRFKLLDYRRERGTYDRIVSVGMFEHVGVSHYVEFFTKVKELLSDDGVDAAALDRAHGTARRPPNTWLGKYIFPGGYNAGPVRKCWRRIEKVGPVGDRRRGFCDCTTQRPCATGACASSPTAKRSSRWPVTTIRFLPDVGVLSRRLRKSPSATCIRWSSRSSSPRRQDAVPLTGAPI